MKFVVRVGEGEACPWSHRVAWYDWLSNQRVCWPAGLHLIARVIRYFWGRSFIWFRRHDAWDKMCADMEHRYFQRYDDCIAHKDHILKQILGCVPEGDNDLVRQKISEAIDHRPKGPQ